MRWFAAVTSVAVVTACGAARAKLAVSRDGRAVLSDAYDGKLDRDWSCGSLRTAYRRLPPDGPMYSTIPQLIGNAAGKACDAALAAVHVGDAEHAVVGALGAPDRAPRCWLYRWPAGGGVVDGAWICFASRRVSAIRVAVHG